ncbi:MAG: VWA domain-containing protein [Gammaproteobacteria bacterium]|nr:MAG: VWA domain-containing protein [Gammaproteobacteria bacterium]
MIDFLSLGFQSPAWLLLLPPLWWLLWLLARYHQRQSMWSRVCDPQLLDKMRVKDSAASYSSWLIWPLAIVLTLAVVAAAGPGWRQQSQPIMESASARIIALDLSQTMLVEDLEPSRFAQSIAAAREIIDSDFDGETGLIAFAGAAFVVSPLSRDANTLLAFIDALEPGLLPLEGTRLDLAIDQAQDLLLASISGRGQIIVITGGTAHRAKALQAALDARGNGHQVSILAIGTAAGGPLIDADGRLRKDGRGKFMLAKTDFTALEAIARAGGGIMLRVSDSSSYHELLGSRITADNLVEATSGANETGRQIANEGFWLIWLMLPFALLLFRKNLFWCFLLTLLLPLGDELQAAEATSIWQHRERLAFAAYQRGDFRRSAELSENLLLQGSAYYRDGQFQKALQIYSLETSATAHYNRGNTLVQLKRIPEAISAYQQALKLDPALANARYNKRLLELFQERQQQTDSKQSGQAEDDSSEFELPDEPGGEGRLGIIGQETENPADQQQLESGFGASTQYGPLDPFEQFDGRDQQLDRFSLSDGINQTQAEILMENWVETLPAASSELFRRKFLRDYQRQQQQPR